MTWAGANDSPGLAALPAAPVGFLVRVPAGDAGEQLLESPLLFRRADDDSITLDRNVDLAVLIEGGLEGERFGNPYGEAVAPALNRRDHSMCCIYNIYT